MIFKVDYAIESDSGCVNLRIGAVHEAQKQLSFTFGPISLQLDRFSEI